MTAQKTPQSIEISGTLEDSLGVPVPNRNIEILVSSAGQQTSRKMLTTGSNGTFSAKIFLEKEKYTVRARFRDEKYYESAEATITSDNAMVLRKSSVKSFVNGLLDQNPDAVRRHVVTDRPPNALWLLIPMGLCSFLVFAIKRDKWNSRSRYEATRKENHTPGIMTARPARYALAAQTSISGIVRDAQNREAIAGVELSLFPLSGSDIKLEVTKQGFFSSPVLARGKWKIRAKAYGYVETERNFEIPHRGEWTNVQIRLLSMRTLALQSYRKVALALLPIPQLWDIWTLRETIDNSSKLLRTPSLLRSLLERVERSSYGRTPPSEQEVEAIETRVSSALGDISRIETRDTTPYRR
ncbi:MAG: carboxypeptidase regulatory-like domain-containing protein [Deltaproteobacteria bacterium]|nr:carboxypeptidase regulatory-like domain-containing protein [Deltaproteobacteria bacterium]